jgi:hypothetical protein
VPGLLKLNSCTLPAPTEDPGQTSTTGLDSENGPPKPKTPVSPYISAFRYNLEDRPVGTCLKDDFVQGIRRLGERGYAIELTVGSRRIQEEQGFGCIMQPRPPRYGCPKISLVVEEVIECIEKVRNGFTREGKTRTKFIIG